MLLEVNDAREEVAEDDEDDPIEASTTSVVYVDLVTDSMVVVKVTVSPGPHGSGE